MQYFIHDTLKHFNSKCVCVCVFGGGRGMGWGGVFFLEDIWDKVFGLFNCKRKQLNFIDFNNDNIDSITYM